MSHDGNWSQGPRKKERWECVVCLKSSGEASVAGTQWRRENEAEGEVSEIAEIAGPNRKGLEGLGFYSEQDEKPPEGPSGAGTDLTYECRGLPLAAYREQTEGVGVGVEVWEVAK